MINWIAGGLIIGVTLYVIISRANRLRKGENVCGCDCSSGDCYENKGK